MLSTKEIFKASPVSIFLYLSIAKLIMKEMPNDDAVDTTDCLASNSNESILPALAIFLACLNVTHPAFTNVWASLGSVTPATFPFLFSLSSGLPLAHTDLWELPRASVYRLSFDNSGTFRSPHQMQNLWF